MCAYSTIRYNAGLFLPSKLRDKIPTLHLRLFPRLYMLTWAKNRENSLTPTPLPQRGAFSLFLSLCLNTSLCQNYRFIREYLRRVNVNLRRTFFGISFYLITFASKFINRYYGKDYSYWRPSYWSLAFGSLCWITAPSRGVAERGRLR